jgi:hypothetical protein
VTAPAAAPLEVARVRRTIAQLREHLADAVQLLGELYEARAWVALGLPSWQALCARELPELAQLLDAAEKRAVVLELRGKGASLRAAGAAVGVSAPTAKSWSDDAGVRPERVTSLDGRVRPASNGVVEQGATRPRRKVARTDRAVELVRAAGPDGITVRELCALTRWQQHVTGPTLTRLVQARRLRYVAPDRRGLFGRYVAGER